jgi:hypothetical protein
MADLVAGPPPPGQQDAPPHPNTTSLEPWPAPGRVPPIRPATSPSSFLVERWAGPSRRVRPQRLSLDGRDPRQRLGAEYRCRQFRRGRRRREDRTIERAGHFDVVVAMAFANHVDRQVPRLARRGHITLGRSMEATRASEAVTTGASRRAVRMMNRPWSMEPPRNPPSSKRPVICTGVAHICAHDVALMGATRALGIRQTAAIVSQVRHCELSDAHTVRPDGIGALAAEVFVAWCASANRERSEPSD